MTEKEIGIDPQFVNVGAIKGPQPWEPYWICNEHNGKGGAYICSIATFLSYEHCEDYIKKFFKPKLRDFMLEKLKQDEKYKTEWLI